MEIISRYIDHGQWGYVRVRLSDGRVVPEHRYLMELHLGRELATHEHIHHKDGDKHNNDLGNLELLTSSDHAKEHVIPAKKRTLTCPACGSEFVRSERYIKSKLSLVQKNFLCSRACRMPR